MSDATTTPERPWTEDWRAYALLALAWVALWTVSRQWLFMVPLALVFFAHPLLRTRVRLKLGIVGHAAVIGVFAVLYNVNPVTGVAGNRLNYSFYISYLALVFAAVKLYSPRDRTLLPRLLLYSAITCGFVSVGLADYIGKDPRWTATSVFGPWTPAPERFYTWLVVAFGVLTIVVLRGALRQRRADPRERPLGPSVVLGVSLALVAALTSAAVWVEKTYYQEVANIYSNLLSGAGGGGGGGGFSDKADLGSVIRQQDGGREVALRVFSERVPGYLRGKAFLSYTGSGWDVSWNPPMAPTPRVGGYAFQGRPPFAEGVAPPMRVHSESEYPTQFFLPLEASGVETTATSLELHTPGYTLRGQGADGGYGVFSDPEPNHVEAELPAYVELPANKAALVAALDATLARLKIEPGAGAQDAVARIAGHFQMRFRYELGVRFKPGVDPIAQFLTGVDPGGHCELFATAGTLLLRRSGVPARYVTGFVCQERNPVGENLWIARSRYAHAWVEFHDPQRGWQTAEFTPAAGVPAAKAASGFDAFLEWVGGAWTRFKAFLAELPGLLLGAIQSLLAWLAGAWWRIGLMVLAVLGIAFAQRLRGRVAAEAERERVFTPELAAQRDRYLTLERKLRGAGLGRRDFETVLEYADRLANEELPEELGPEQAVKFLREFALQRYGAAPVPSV